MLLVLIDAGVLLALLQAFNEGVEFGSSFGVALVAALATNGLAYALSSVMGIGGVVLAVFIVAALLGAAVAFLFAIEVKRSMLIGGIFMVVHLALNVGFSLMFGQ